MGKKKELHAGNSYYEINGQKVFITCNREYTSAKAYPYLVYPWLMELDSDSFVSAHPIAHCPIAATEELVESGICLSERCRPCIWRESYTTNLHNWLEPTKEDIPLAGSRCGLWVNLSNSFQAGGFSPDCICYRTEPVPPLQAGADPWLVKMVTAKLRRGRARFVACEMLCPDKRELMAALAEESAVFVLQTDVIAETPAAMREMDWHMVQWMKIPCQDLDRAVALLLNELGVMDAGTPMLYCPDADRLFACAMEAEGYRWGYYVID